MNFEKSPKFIKRVVDGDSSPPFESRVCEIRDSIIAFACGTCKNGSPHVIGSGFSVKTGEGNDKLFATCMHVIREIIRLRDLDDVELENESLIDKKRYIAFLNKDKYEWKEVGPINFYKDVRENFPDNIQIQKDKDNLLQRDDVGICRIPEINLPPLVLSPDEYFMGTELGIMGFPVFENLQKISVQPYVIKSILSSHMTYPFNRNGECIESERIALDCIAGPGFSGSPVFSVRDGKIIGMVDYLPQEVAVEDIKITYPNLIEGDVRVYYPAGISFAVPSKLIKKYLEYSLKGDWDKRGEQTIGLSRKP